MTRDRHNWSCAWKRWKIQLRLGASKLDLYQQELCRLIQAMLSTCNRSSTYPLPGPLHNIKANHAEKTFPDIERTFPKEKLQAFFMEHDIEKKQDECTPTSFTLLCPEMLYALFFFCDERKAEWVRGIVKIRNAVHIKCDERKKYVCMLSLLYTLCSFPMLNI